MCTIFSLRFKTFSVVYVRHNSNSTIVNHQHDSLDVFLSIKNVFFACHCRVRGVRKECVFQMVTQKGRVNINEINQECFWNDKGFELIIFCKSFGCTFVCLLFLRGFSLDSFICFKLWNFYSLNTDSKAQVKNNVKSFRKNRIFFRKFSILYSDSSLGGVSL